MSEFGWAIVGPGPIAHRFAQAVRELPGMRLAAVQGRDQGRSEDFARDWADGGEAISAGTELDAVLNNPAVDGVYIATPHAFHAPVIRRCLLAGKPVLCEKTMVVNEALARELTDLSKARGVFLMEALWTRFLPIYEVVGDWLTRQAIGELRGLQSSFFFNVPFNPATRLFDPAQAGGALLDIGVYNLAVTQWSLLKALGSVPALESISASGVVGPSGVDQRLAGSLQFTGGLVSQFQCGFDGRADNTFHILGERGTITIGSRFWGASDASLSLFEQPTEHAHRPLRINGFEGEIEEAVACIRRGAIESPAMPHADSLQLVSWMDRIRAILGLSYPFE